MQAHSGFLEQSWGHSWTCDGVGKNLRHSVPYIPSWNGEQSWDLRPGTWKLEEAIPSSLWAAQEQNSPPIPIQQWGRDSVQVFPPVPAGSSASWLLLDLTGASPATPASPLRPITLPKPTKHAHRGHFCSLERACCLAFRARPPGFTSSLLNPMRPYSLSARGTQRQ